MADREAKRKAVGLLSGGLDSTLAIKLVQEQGIDVVALNFSTIFCRCNRKGGCGSEAYRVTRELGLPLKVITLTDEYLEVVKRPKHGYGQGLNPCLDCRILMFKKAKAHMLQIGASFLVTGEVLGQRPMSQHRRAIRLIERESDLEGFILRPLSAKHFPPSIPEREGWVDREKLLDLTGRSRKPQMKLAEELQIWEYPCSAGGCLLTDLSFAARMRDLMEFKPGFGLHDVRLLKVGRHFRLAERARLVVGRSRAENEIIHSLAEEGDLLLRAEEVVGPTSLLRGMYDEGLIALAASITARYSDMDGMPTAKIGFGKGNGPFQGSLVVRPIAHESLDALRIGDRRIVKPTPGKG